MPILPDLRTVLKWSTLLFIGLSAPHWAGAASDLDEFKVKREQVYAFVQKPTVQRQGNQFSIEFESKGYCDATVAIEKVDGRIVRHLASGVLGKNAPPPFKKGALKQEIHWDGKDDQGNYIDDLDRHEVRVSLGLMPRFEKSLFWSPYKRVGRGSPLIAAAPEGVYVFGSCGLDSLRLYNHKGVYVRTLYPFPADKVKDVQGLHWRKAPQDGRSLPRKEGYLQGTLLNSGSNAGFNTKGGFGFSESRGGVGATALAVNGNRIALAMLQLNRLASDGTSGRLPLKGPSTRIGETVQGKPINVGPRSVAFSPDGKTIYLTGYTCKSGLHRRPWAHGVARLSYAEDGKLEPFKGTLSFEDKAAGSTNEQFKVPTSVDCDAKGNVYVADHGNNRIQVFRPDGSHLKSIPVTRPAHIHVSRQTGELHVFTWDFLSHLIRNQGAVKPRYLRLKSLSDPKELASYPLPLIREYPYHSGGLNYRVAVDEYATPPTIWIVPASAWHRMNTVLTHQDWKGSSIRMLQEQKGKLVEIRNFGQQAADALKRYKPAVYFRQRLYVNPKNEKLYIAEGAIHNKSTSQLVKIDPESGACELEEMPFDAEDFCFDLEGRAYLRTGKFVVRYDSESWREIPWDYGEEVRGLNFPGSGGARSANPISALRIPGHRAPARHHNGGFDINARGHLLVSTATTGNRPDNRLDSRPGKKALDAKEVEGKYTPRLYPGRFWHGELHVWDKHGKMIREDVVPGLNVLDGIGIDQEDSIYVLSQSRRILNGKRYFNPKSETLIKFRPGKARLLSMSKRNKVPLDPSQYPKGHPDITGPGIETAWVKEAEWFYGGVGFDAGPCVCWNARFDLDYFARSWAPEPSHYSVAVLDSNGNLITRIGRYGNVDDGVPQTKNPLLPKPRSLGGDEVGLFHASYVTTHTDRRLFIADAGNSRIVSVQLDYHASHSVGLGGAKGSVEK